MTGHSNMHGLVRRQAPGAPLTSLPTIITGVNSHASIPTGQTSLAIDTGSPLTYITKTFLDSQTVNGVPTVFTNTRSIPITDPAEYSSILASQTPDNASPSATSSASSTASSTAAAKQPGSNNLGTLIPAIVVPIAVVFIGSFVAFWIIMRKRHRKQLKEEPEFVMATKPEKPITRGNSASSGHSSTRELVPMSKLEKEMVVTTTSDVKRSSLDMFPPSYAPQGDIGVARPMTPPDKKDNGDKKSFKNFSSVRPGTGNGNRSRSGSTAQARDRSNSRPGNHGAPPPRPSRGPSPATHVPRGQAIGQPRFHSRSPPRLHGISPNGSLSDALRPPPAATADPPTPTGAFNGASPISQYSPIVKDTPNMAGVALEPKPKPSPAALNLKNSSNLSRGTESPVDDGILSRENMRIARLANSSRLGLTDSPIDNDFARHEQNGRSLSPLTETHSRSDGSATSPRLPPPLSRDDMPPPNRPFARGPDSPAGGSSIYPSPSIGTGATPRLPQYGIGPSTTSLTMSDAHALGGASSAQAQRASIVSRLSSDDGYVDMELDGKSDVSSLDERDRWEMESDMRAGSHLGGTYNSHRPGDGELSPVETTAPSASSAGTGTGKPNIRDRDSEGPFVLSRY